LTKIRRMIQIIRLPLWLSLAAVAAFTASTHPRLQEQIRLDGKPEPAGYGPLCLLSGAPSENNSELWKLEHPRLIPFELLEAGYPEEGWDGHPVVARVTCTAYTSRICETDSTPEITATNKRVRPGYIALSRDLISFYTPGAPFSYGDRIELIGLGTFQVEDTMNSRWRRRADIWVGSLDVAWAWGHRTVLIAKLEDQSEDVALLQRLPSRPEDT
jgi:3D (Asp-Asp-Asp) domain-containing protein